jgi:hypothetical protein
MSGIFGNRGLDPYKGYKKMLKTADFFKADKNCEAGQYTLLGYYTVGAQQLACVGQGAKATNPMQQGRPYIKVMSNDVTPIEVVGWIKITHESAQGTNTQKILEERTEEFNQSTRSERLCLPCQTEVGFLPVKQDSKIGIYFKPDGTDEIGFDTGETDIRLPITIWE